MAYSEKEINAIVLAIDEASSNIMRYGYKNCIDGEIMIEITTDHQHAIFRLHDHAPQVTDDCIKAVPSSPLEPGGLGIMLMQEVMESVRFVHTDNCPGNILEMRINLPEENHYNEF